MSMMKMKEAKKPSAVTGHEIVLKNGLTVITLNQIALLFALSESPGQCISSTRLLAAAALPFRSALDAEGEYEGPSRMLECCSELPSEWVKREYCGSKVKATLTPRGERILSGEVQLKVRRAAHWISAYKAKGWRLDRTLASGTDEYSHPKRAEKILCTTDLEIPAGALPVLLEAAGLSRPVRPTSGKLPSSRSKTGERSTS